MNVPHVLIVDDDIDDIVIYTQAFEQSRHFLQTSFFQTSEAVIPYLNSLSDEQLPHLIITDLNMPKLNGFELLRQLKSCPRLKQISVLVCSTSTLPSDKQTCLMLGAVGYIVKPLRLKEYIELVDEVAAQWLQKNPK